VLRDHGTDYALVSVEDWHRHESADARTPASHGTPFGLVMRDFGFGPEVTVPCREMTTGDHASIGVQDGDALDADDVERTLCDIEHLGVPALGQRLLQRWISGDRSDSGSTSVQRTAQRERRAAGARQEPFTQARLDLLRRDREA
jgi:hypothetical protein